MVWPVGFEPTKATSMTLPRPLAYAMGIAGGLPIPLTATTSLYTDLTEKSTISGKYF